MTLVVLDDFVFEDFEVPESIGFGGRQMLAIKRQVGGLKVVDSMGPDDAPLRWKGRFRGPDAVTRARYIDTKRKAGKALLLTWGELAFTVVIDEFEPDYTYELEIPYSIRCEVVQDENSPVESIAETSIDESLDADMLEVSGLAAGIGDLSLTGLVGTLGTAIGAAGSFVGAGPSLINSVLNPIAAVQARVDSLISGADSVLAGIPFLGGAVSGALGSSMVTDLLAQSGAMEQAYQLFDMTSLLGRMSTNLSSIGLAGAEVVVAGADLYRMATDTYGDPTEWTTIARANGILDPIIEGVQTILIPPLPLGHDGVPKS